MKLGDFGISKALNNEDDMSKTLCGTPYFWPPEVCMKAPYNSKADIWAMGVIIYELIHFRKPFNGTCIEELEIEIIGKNLDPLGKGWSSDMQDLINCLLDKD